MADTRIAGIRDSRVAAHAAALEAGDRGLLFVALVETSAMVGNYLAQKWGGSYDVERTHNYLRVMADHQLRLIPEYKPAKAAPSLEDVGPTTDGLGSATAAMGFGVREFTNQDPRKWELVWHHNTGHDARISHSDMDGTTTDAATGFDVEPGLGAPGCGCSIEPINPTGGLTMSPSEMTLGELERLAAQFYKDLGKGEKYAGKWDRVALKGFQTHSYDLQAALREGRKLTGMEKIGGLPANSRVRWLDDAIRQGQLGDDTILYRGVSEDLVKGWKVGDNFIDPAYGSTSISEGIARQFGDRVLEIHAGSGTNAAFLGSKFADQSLGEILLGRGTRYEVKEILTDRIIVEVQGIAPKVAERIAEKVTAAAGRFKTVRECEEFIDQTIYDAQVRAGIQEGRTVGQTMLRMNGKDIGLDMANRLTEIAERTAAKAPEMWGRTAGFTMDDRFGSSTYAWVQGLDQRIHLEIANWAGSRYKDFGLSGFTRNLEQLEKSLLQDAASGFHPAAGLDSVIQHEMGHVYFGSSGMFGASARMNEMILETAQDLAKQGFDDYFSTLVVGDPSKLAKLVSRYAKESYAEFTAEVTAAVLAENERYVANMLGKEFIRTIRKIFKKRGLIT